MDMPIVRTVGPTGEYDHEALIPNPSFRCFYKTPTFEPCAFHVLPRDYGSVLYMGDKSAPLNLQTQVIKWLHYTCHFNAVLQQIWNSIFDAEML